MLMSMDSAPPAPTEGARRPCFNCNFINAAGAAACEHCGADLRGVPFQRDIKMEAHLTAVAISFIIYGSLMALLGVILMVSGFVKFGLEYYRHIISPWNLSGVGLGLAGVLLGVYLRRYSNIARVTAGVLTTLALLFQWLFGPALTWLFAVFAGPTLWALFNHRAAEICTEGYRHMVGSRRGVPPGTYRSPFFWGPLLLLALFGVGIVAFWL
jgi:hypothetical protein